MLKTVTIIQLQRIINYSSKVMSSYMYNVHFSHYSKITSIYSISQNSRLERVLMQYLSGSASQEKLGLDTGSWATGWTALLVEYNRTMYVSVRENQYCTRRRHLELNRQEWKSAWAPRWAAAFRAAREWIRPRGRPQPHVSRVPIGQLCCTVHCAAYLLLV